MLPTRRDLLDLVTRVAALPAGAQFFSEWLSAAQTHQHTDTSKAPPEPSLLHNYAPKFFGEEDFEALQAFTDILIPRDESPGARDAHCAQFIDFLVYSAAEGAPEMQKQWRDAMAVLQQTGFHSAAPREREALIEGISRAERDRTAKHAAYPVYLLIKQQNTFAFYTSRAGMIETLDYKGNSYNESFPPCTHPEHRVV